MKFALFLAVLPVILLPSSALADTASQYITVAPVEVNIDNLSPGEAAEFELTIHNQEERAHVFILTPFQPPEQERRQGRDEFPHDSWISFSSQVIGVAPNSEATVMVTVAVPPAQEWAGKDWEIWLGVAAESSDVLVVQLYVRLLVSTSAAAEAESDAGLVVGIAAAAVVLGYTAYYYSRHRPSSRKSRQSSEFK
ncbi:MAG: hypothetical protein R6U93_01210 [Dehalococcoidia bacterium]